jgi:DNA-binding CsgD family transcriptional regulator
MQFERVVNRVADLALNARSAAEYRRNLLEVLLEAIGGDHGAVCAARGTEVVATTVSPQADASFGSLLAASIPQFSFASPDTALLPRTQRDSDVLSRRSRERTPLYTEFLRPQGIRECAMRYWRHDLVANWICLAPTGTVRRAPFYRRAQATIDRLFPVLALGARVHSPGHAPSDGPRGVDPVALWTGEHGLTGAEHKLVLLIERGLTNSEIATCLGLSPNTVRNRLAVVFRKLGVTRRAELVYVTGLARSH